MKTEAFAAVATKLLVGVATAATLAGSGAIITSARTNAVQDQRLEQHDKAFEKIDTLSTKLDETNKSMAVLQERLNQEARNREPRQ